MAEADEAWGKCRRERVGVAPSSSDPCAVTPVLSLPSRLPASSQTIGAVVHLRYTERPGVGAAQRPRPGLPTCPPLHMAVLWSARFMLVFTRKAERVEPRH